jgi:DNA polymerase III psi subunit
MFLKEGQDSMKELQGASIDCSQISCSLIHVTAAKVLFSPTWDTVSETEDFKLALWASLQASLHQKKDLSVGGIYDQVFHF